MTTISNSLYGCMIRTQFGKTKPNSLRISSGLDEDIDENRARRGGSGDKAAQMTLGQAVHLIVLWDSELRLELFAINRAAPHSPMTPAVLAAVIAGR